MIPQFPYYNIVPPFRLYKVKYYRVIISRGEVAALALYILYQYTVQQYSIRDKGGLALIFIILASAATKMYGLVLYSTENCRRRAKGPACACAYLVKIRARSILFKALEERGTKSMDQCLFHVAEAAFTATHTVEALRHQLLLLRRESSSI